MHMISEVVPRERIELAVLTADQSWVQSAAEELIQSGVRGIINFCPCEIACRDPDVWILHLSLVSELRILSALAALSSESRSMQQE